MRTPLFVNPYFVPVTVKVTSELAVPVALRTGTIAELLLVALTGTNLAPFASASTRCALVTDRRTEALKGIAVW